MIKNKNQNKAVSIAAETLIQNKVDDAILIDLQQYNTLTYDYLIVCTCQSESQMRTILNSTHKAMNQNNEQGSRVEYQPGAKWGLLDCGDLILHVFEKNARNYYALEQLWNDAIITPLKPEDYLIKKEEEINNDAFL